MTEFVTEFDEVPSFWQFLNGLDCNDLVAELVQNDLDQDATQTVISFEKDQLICEGNGKPVDGDGWKRLRSIQGAGDQVPAKRGKIGVKNHGLKTAFTIGDEIQLFSSGKKIIQTLYKNGRDQDPYPGTSAIPELDPEAPADGCRILVRYRNADIKPKEGEKLVFGKVAAQDIDMLFKSACANTPEQFAGIVSPNSVSRYTVMLRHWCLGDAQFVFSCRRPRKINGMKSVEIFRRRCEVSGTIDPLPTGLLEEAAQYALPLREPLKKRVADFFRRQNRFFIEVSWPVDKRGKPQLGVGKFRYPIGYPEASHEARTGHATYFNAPIVSDTERHGPARNEATNEELRQECEKLLINVIARYTVPRWKTDGLNLLVPSSDLNANDSRKSIRSMLAELAEMGTLPTLSWHEAAKLSVSGNKQKTKYHVALSNINREKKRRRKYQFIVPAMTSAPEKFHSSLSVISPRSERQLDPRIYPTMFSLLTDKKTDGWCKHFITFDENDVSDRITEQNSKYFDALDQTRDMSQVILARCYLDVIHEALNNNHNWDTETLLNKLLLPDHEQKPVHFDELYASVSLPDGIPGLELPPILHKELTSHPLLCKQKWRRPNYTLTKFLESGLLEKTNEQTQKQFWRWLHKNENIIKRDDRGRLANLPIWPDVDGNFFKLNSLCEPRSERVADILGISIHRPHTQVRRSKLVGTGRRRKTSVRQTPTLEEIDGWRDIRRKPFISKRGEILDTEEIDNLIKLENDYALLLRNPAIARVLKQLDIRILSLAEDGTIQWRTELVIPSKTNKLLMLSGRFMLKFNRHAAALNQLSQALSKPTADMLLATFQEDAENDQALQARLKQFLALQPENQHRDKLAKMSILPADDRLRAPSELAFKGNRGDYWGAWKTPIPTKGLSQNDQKRYRDVGVTSSLPNSETSCAFFEWLSTRNVSVQTQHIPCVFRHILNEKGAMNWVDIFPDIPFIPVKTRDGVFLVSLSQVHRGLVYLPDADDKIVSEIRERDTGIKIVINTIKEIKRPISESLSKLGVKSLRERLGEPERVIAEGDTKQKDRSLLEKAGELKSLSFQNTFQKRLNELEVKSEAVRNDWHNRLAQIQGIYFTEDLLAHYRLRNRLYRASVDAGLDKKTGIFWIKQGKENRFYETVAEQLIFKPGTPRIYFLALKEMLEIEIDDPSFRQHDINLPDSENQEGCDDELTEAGENGDSDLGEAIAGHAPFTPDPLRNNPTPQPFTSSIETTQQPRIQQDDIEKEQNNTVAASQRSVPELEKIHKEELKEQHYAYHCQICLCQNLPEKLAPSGSYVEWAEIRRYVMEAHHLDSVSAGGARHAGNMILLCKLHHNNYGPRLTRSAITSALRDKSQEKMIFFDKDKTELRGRIITLKIPDIFDEVDLFFTDQHTKWWIDNA